MSRKESNHREAGLSEAERFLAEYPVLAERLQAVYREADRFQIVCHLQADRFQAERLQADRLRAEDPSEAELDVVAHELGHSLVVPREAERIEAELSRIKWQLHFDGLDHYHGAGALVMTAGSAGMIAASCLALGPLWAGFLAGALPTFLLTTLVHPEHA